MVRVLGKKILELCDALGRPALLIGQIFYWLFNGRWEKREILSQMVKIGVDSLPVVCLTSFFTGMVLALQTGTSSKNIFNEPVYVGTLVSLSMVLELGPVLTSLVVSGRVGAAITAEIGTMQVTEQVDALYTLGTHPVNYLAVPRFLGCVCMIPILATFADFIGIMGGWIVSIVKLGIPSTVYKQDILEWVGMDDIWHGLIKAFFFGGIIAVVSCYQGFSTKGGAEGVGKHTTRAVVTSMVLILVIDYFLSAFLMAIGIGD